jgi:hypothetical protein
MMPRLAKLPTKLALPLALGLAAASLSACTSSGSFESDSDHGWLSGYQVDKNSDGSWSQDEVSAAFSNADADGDGQLSAGERSGGRR